MEQVTLEFNLELLEQLQRARYCYLLYRRKNGYSELTPIRENTEDGTDFYIIDIYDEQAYEMARGVLNWKFYVLFQILDSKL